MQFMEEDAANWYEGDGFDAAKHIRLKRAADLEGSGSGMTTTDVPSTTAQEGSGVEPTTTATGNM